MIGQTISHYTILEKLGEGGMGVVYRAHDTRLDRDVALKFLPPGLTEQPELRDRFIHEARAASALEHPNICNIHEIAETGDGRSFIVMAYYPGETLARRISRGPVRWREAIGIALQAGRGLQRAHEQGIIHRDIKPANLIITDHEEVKILDFGLAKLSGAARLTRTGSTAGTTAYMSPEQLRGDPLDHRTDIWSLGVVLHEMLSGSRPFSGDYPQAMMYAILNTDPAPLTVSGLPGGIARSVGKMLSRNREDRYSSMEEVIADLGRIAAEGTAEISTGGVDPGRKKKLFVASLTATILAVALTTIIMVTSTSTRILPLEPAEYLLVGDFGNRTGDPVFDHSLTEAVRVSLRQSSLFNLLPTDRVLGALNRMKVPLSGPLSDTTAVDLARREGVRVVVAGNITLLGTRYVVSGKIIDAVSGETVNVLRREAAGAENVLSAIDLLCEDIRENLGESMQNIAAYSMPLEQVSTPSLEALELYSRGNLLEGEGEFAKAALLKEQAVEKDSLFTIAISDLSYIHRKLGNDSLAISYHNRVLPLLDRVTDRERYYILSIYYGPSFELDFPKAIENIQQLILRDPRDAVAYATLGNFAMHLGDIKTALEADHRSLSLDSMYAGTVYNNMGFALAIAGDTKEAMRYFRKSQAVRPAYHTIDMYIAQCHWLGGEFDSARQRLLSILPDADPRDRILAYSMLVSLHYYQGQLGMAAGMCREGIAYCRSVRRGGDEAYFHYLTGEISRELGDMATYAREMEMAGQLSASPFMELPLIGVSYASTGRFKDAGGVHTRLATLGSIDLYFLKRRGDFRHLISGALALSRGDSGKAEEEFAAVERVHSADPYYLLARHGLARSLAGRSDSSAIRILEDLLGRKGESILAHVLSYRRSGTWTGILSPGTQLELGKLYLNRNDTTAAEHHLRSCLDCWQQADDQFTPAKEAKALLAGLMKAR